MVDNCKIVPNGPNDQSRQVDSDLDGYGNRCDTDFNQDTATTGADYAQILGALSSSFVDLGCLLGTAPCPTVSCEQDIDGDSVVTLGDLKLFANKFSQPPSSPGPSGLACAGTIPCYAHEPLSLTTGGWVAIFEGVFSCGVEESPKAVVSVRSYGRLRGNESN